MEDWEDRRSTSGYNYCLGKGAISWRLKKQATVLLSSTESKYKAMSDLCKEGSWLRRLLIELHLCSFLAIPLHVNNSGAEALAKNPQHHARTKHIHTRFHFVRECVNTKKLMVLHISTKDMLANMLKNLSLVSCWNNIAQCLVWFDFFFPQVFSKGGCWIKINPYCYCLLLLKCYLYFT